MFRITGQTCHAFTLQEVLIMAATNVESTRLTFADRVSAARTRHARYVQRTSAAKGQQL